MITVFTAITATHVWAAIQDQRKWRTSRALSEANTPERYLEMMRRVIDMACIIEIVRFNSGKSHYDFNFSAVVDTFSREDLSQTMSLDEMVALEASV